MDGSGPILDRTPTIISTVVEPRPVESGDMASPKAVQTVLLEPKPKRHTQLGQAYQQTNEVGNRLEKLRGPEDDMQEELAVLTFGEADPKPEAVQAYAAITRLSATA